MVHLKQYVSRIFAFSLCCVLYMYSDSAMLICSSQTMEYLKQAASFILGKRGKDV